MRTSTSATAVRVFPVPVAITIRNLRPLGLDRLEERADGLDLVVAAGDRRIDQLDGEGPLLSPALAIHSRSSGVGKPKTFAGG